MRTIDPSRWRLLPLAIVPWLLAGCAGFSPDGGFGALPQVCQPRLQPGRIERLAGLRRLGQMRRARRPSRYNAVQITREARRQQCAVRVTRRHRTCWESRKQGF